MKQDSSASKCICYPTAFCNSKLLADEDITFTTGHRGAPVWQAHDRNSCSHADNHNKSGIVFKGMQFQSRLSRGLHPCSGLRSRDNLSHNGLNDTIL
eukprot:1138506-Pelagomonas_calceolata.AAC.6